MEFCGHETLATAHCLVSILNCNNDRIVFETKSEELTVDVKDGFYYMDFPSRMPEPSSLLDIITRSINIQPKKVFKLRGYFLVYKSEKDIKKLKYPFSTLSI